MNPEITYSLEVSFTDASLATKESFKGWLDSKGVSSYVEACRDDLDISPVDYDPVSFEKESQLDPIVIYRFDHQELIKIRDEALYRFEGKLNCSIQDLDTKSWQDGWKDSFKPIHTQRFVILPPWETHTATDKEALVIEPAMAFGTGQHPTTVLCLEAFEKLCSLKQIQKVLDIGTGTGVLAIAAHKLGAIEVIGTDIDPDSVLAAKENARINQAACNFQVGTFIGDTFDVVIANVLKPFFMAEFDSFPKSQFLILSGFLVDDIADILAKAPLNYTLWEKYEKDEWSCLVLSQ
jgi:ribosomal protein L11 methyltransferase